MHHGGIDTKHPTSLSARRAWIEIPTMRLRPHRRFVALRKESVDRNLYVLYGVGYIAVALRKESVDRNCQAISAEF